MSHVCLVQDMGYFIHHCSILMCSKNFIQNAGTVIFIYYGPLHRCDHDFSKHPERYHKYSPAQVEEMIERLFDISA